MGEEMMFSPIKCACCERLNPSSVCITCRNYIDAFLKLDIEIEIIIAYVKKRRKQQRGI